MDASTRFTRLSAKAVLAGTWGMVCALILAAPLLSAHHYHKTSSILYLLFSPICHQMPNRSFYISGFALAVCHRCSGIYLGLFLGSFLHNYLIDYFAGRRRFIVLFSCIPLIVDALAVPAGIWTGSWITRFATGLLFGTLISSLLLRGLAEFMDETLRCRFLIQHLRIKGAL
jgi:uncharacterized membrane protein